MHIKSVAMLAASLVICAAHGQNIQINLFAVGAEHPVIRGSTSLPDGTKLTVMLKKPWLPDGQQRIARGLPACEDNCLPSEDYVTVARGAFTTKPFSFVDHKPIRAGIYEVEVWLPLRSGETWEQFQVRNGFRPVFVGTVAIPEAPAAQNGANAPHAISVISMPCSKYVIMYGTPQSSEFTDQLVDLVSDQKIELGNVANVLDYVATECRLNERLTIGQATANLTAQAKENRLPPIPVGGATGDPKTLVSRKAFEAWVHHLGPRPEL